MIFGPGKTAIYTKDRHWHADNHSLVSEVGRRTFEEVFSRKETVNKAFHFNYV